MLVGDAQKRPDQHICALGQPRLSHQQHVVVAATRDASVVHAHECVHQVPRHATRNPQCVNLPGVKDHDAAGKVRDHAGQPRRQIVTHASGKARRAAEDRGRVGRKFDDGRCAREPLNQNARHTGSKRRITNDDIVTTAFAGKLDPFLHVEDQLFDFGGETALVRPRPRVELECAERSIDPRQVFGRIRRVGTQPCRDVITVEIARKRGREIEHHIRRDVQEARLPGGGHTHASSFNGHSADSGVRMR